MTEMQKPAPPKPRSGVGGWVKGLDAGAVASLVLALFVMLFGGFDLHFGSASLRVHSTLRLLFVGLSLAAIRHAAHPQSPLHRRLLRAVRSCAAGSALAIVPAAVSMRIVVLVIGYLSVITVGVDRATMGFELSPDPAFNLSGRFDSGWYGGIALDGYAFSGSFDRQQNIAFFPAFPMLMRAVGYPIGAFAQGVPRERRMARLLWGGVILSLVAFAWAAVYLWRLARDTIGEDRAGSAVALLSAYPFAVFFSVAYTESLFLLGAVAAIYHFRRGELARAAARGLLVGLTRPNGCFLSIVLALLIFEKLRVSEIFKFPNSQISKCLAAAAAPGLGMLIYSAYVNHLTGAWFGWARLHEEWGRSYSGLAPLERAYGWITHEGLLPVVQNIPYDTLNSLGLIFAVLMVWPVFRRLGVAYTAFVLVNLVPPMLAGGVLSMGRITSTLFPLFLALAASVSPRAIPPLITAFAMGQALTAVLFFTWRPLF